MGLDSDDVLGMYDRHARELVGYFLRRVHDPELALDLLSETFLAAFAARRECRAEDDAQRAAWLYRIAANELGMHRRRIAGESNALARLAGDLLRPAIDAELERIEQFGGDADLHRLLEEAFAQLSEEQEQAILARVLRERSYTEVAAELGITEQAARARVSRGLQLLRRAVGPAREGA